jgi:hypothetical protein
MGVIEKEQTSQDEQEKTEEDQGVNHIKRPSPFPSLLNMDLFFHEE